MGLIQSVICGVVLCFERVVSWTCCALVLMTIMVLVILFTLYGISLGYHYGQKELAKYLGSSDESKKSETGAEALSEPVVRLVAVNRSQGEQVTDVMSGHAYQTRAITQSVFLESSATPIIVLESERPNQQFELTPHERELARKLIGRFRRARRNNSTIVQILNLGGSDKRFTSETNTKDAT
ncbi:unnamed protein product, partial [Iphiclides podalirius]